ncbi:LysR substrate-binding domain-containing protein [Ruegeria aquimaris]|uniref:LysR substrate-binding domain-containing protein n=1 Tax=Ruegeria aquimaris TaxID=2984333 RepID=A0ABT3ALX6_9RHOB|nr:LysR substrate-binding domain-containing protein [Ruegeria sp. XHP0148]MCV2889694.1 LysR substrate-binding domain-containing protein [Ruegeria sp. XHP0148]
MNNPYRALPPLSALIGFEAAARCLSFSRAAEELNVTQSAVSHQIRMLEAHLGQPLFLRIGRRIELTDAGQDLLATAQEALETVRHGVRRLHAYTKPGSVILMMTPALAQGWFLPRLARLRAELPHVEPWLHTTTEAWVPEEAEIDIVLSDTPWADERTLSRPLLPDRLWPLAAPGVAATLPQTADSHRLDHAALLHDEGEDDWQKWFTQAKSARREFAAGLNFSDPAMMLQAAAAGLGICLGSEITAGSFLANGTLVRAAATPLETERRYYLSVWTRNLSRRAVQDLWIWLLARPDP